tara:strand:+ start:151271 stop:151504 length:234 start_codon:yes stop_codon:yes gene_type:complete
MKHSDSIRAISTLPVQSAPTLAAPGSKQFAMGVAKGGAARMGTRRSGQPATERQEQNRYRFVIMMSLGKDLRLTIVN